MLSNVIIITESDVIVLFTDCRVIDYIFPTVGVGAMAVNILQKFGRRVREVRKSKGLSQEELGFQAGIHRTYVGAVERGEQNISLKNIEKLAKALGVKVGELFP